MNREEKFMSSALRLAEKGKGLTYPNPAVGCVLVKDNKIIGRGYHKKAGEPHAEINAINNVKGRIPTGTEMYVTLEPCSHFGRTPPCTESIINNKIKKVYIGSTDSNLLVKGIEILRRHNIEVHQGILKERCDLLNEDYFFFMKTNKPFVTVKSGVTLDGKIAAANGDARWITNEKARKYGHYLRKINSALVIGINTILIDNPRLNIRDSGREKKHTNLIVLDSKLRIKPDCNIFKNNPAEKIFIMTSKNKNKTKKAKLLKETGVNIVYVNKKNNYLDLKEVLHFCSEKNFSSILIEGGSRVTGNFFENNLVNKVVIMYAPKILGGIKSIPFLVTTEKNKLSESIELQDISIKWFNNNFVVTGYVYRNN